jgi:chromosome segregation ATPase
MSDTVSVEFIGKRLDEVQREQRRQGERIEFLSDQLGELRAATVTRDLAERLMIRAGERFTSLEARLASLEGRFASLEAGFASLEGRLASLEGRFASLEARLDRITVVLEQLAESTDRIIRAVNPGGPAA